MSESASALNELAFAVENECGCNERPIVLRALRDGARDFCIRSEAWVCDSWYDNEPDADLYDGAGALDAYVHRVLNVEYLRNGNIIPLREQEYELAGTNLVKVKRPHPEEVSEIRIRAVLIPNPGSETLPDELAKRYRDGIVYAACMRIVRQAGKPWFSPELEQMFQLNYLREVTKAICAIQSQYETR